MKTLISLAVIITLTSGCATVTRGTTQHVSVDSAPQGALVTTQTGQTLRTPGSLELKRNQPHYLSCKLDGYEESKQVLTPTVSGGGAAGMAGNILVGGLIGAAVDAGSGAMYDLTPSAVYFQLEEEKKK
jgi:hypothetical protein